VATDKYGNYTLASGGIGATVVPFIPRAVRLNVDQIQLFVSNATAKEMEQFKFKMQRYPGPKAGSPYVRRELAGGMMATWLMNDQRGIATDVYNIQRAAVFVYGDNAGGGQQLQHIQTGWPNMYKEFQKWKPRVLAAAQEALNETVLAQGFGVPAS
jgi:hypothetical protein